MNNLLLYGIRILVGKSWINNNNNNNNFMQIVFDVLTRITSFGIGFTVRIS